MIFGELLGEDGYDGADGGRLGLLEVTLDWPAAGTWGTLQVYDQQDREALFRFILRHVALLQGGRYVVVHMGQPWHSSAAALTSPLVPSGNVYNDEKRYVTSASVPRPRSPRRPRG